MTAPFVPSCTWTQLRQPRNERQIFVTSQLNSLEPLGRNRKAVSKSVNSVEERPIVRGVQVGTMQPLKIRLHPSGICKISKTDMLIRPLKGHRDTVPHPRVASVAPPELQPVHFEKMYIHDVLYNVTERIVCLKCWFCGPDKGTLHAYACIMYVHSICITILYTYTNVRTFMHSHWKPQHPLCSWSGYWPALRCQPTNSVSTVPTTIRTTGNSSVALDFSEQTLLVYFCGPVL